MGGEVGVSWGGGSEFDLEAPSFRDTMAKHAACGGFLHFLAELEKIAPAGQFQQMAAHLQHQFEFGYIDADLLHALETSVPPGKLGDVSAFRLGVCESAPIKHEDIA